MKLTKTREISAYTYNTLPKKLFDDNRLVAWQIDFLPCIGLLKDVTNYHLTFQWIFWSLCISYWIEENKEEFKPF